MENLIPAGKMIKALKKEHLEIWLGLNKDLEGVYQGKTESR